MIEPFHWTASRKVALLNFLDAGLMAEAEACQRFALSTEELAGWRVRLERYGRQGLNATLVQECRT